MVAAIVDISGRPRALPACAASLAAGQGRQRASDAPNALVGRVRAVRSPAAGGRDGAGEGLRL